MYHKTRGIVLHTIKYSETSVIAKIYTEKLGLQSYIVKGIRAVKSKSKAALLQPMTLLEMEVSHRENKQLQFIKEFRRSEVYKSIPFNTVKSAVALFILEVISKSLRGHESDAGLFEFIYESFCALDKIPETDPDFPLLFLVHFSRLLGFAPHGNFSDENCFFEMSEGLFTNNQSLLHIMDKRESTLLNDLLSKNLFAINPAKTLRTERKTMLKNLIKYYQLHIENFSLKSPEILEEILD